MWTVLLVEDELFVRESIKQIIAWEKEGFTVIGEAANGQEAYDLIKQYQPDIVICDIMMPVMDGVELLKKVRAQGWNNHFLMLTAHTEFEYARQAVEYGASNYILKLSMSIESLLEALQKIREELELQWNQNLVGVEGFYESGWQKVLNDEEIKEADRHTLLQFQKLYGNHLIIAATMTEKATEAEHDNLPDLLGMREGSVVHSYSALGHTSYFCWSNQPINLDKHKAKDCQLVFKEVGELSAFMDSWKQVVDLLDSIWYGKETDMLEKTRLSGGSAKESLPWELESRFFHTVEQKKTENCKQVIEELWNYMEKQGFSMIRVKETALWIDQLVGKVVQKDSQCESAIKTASTHHRLKELVEEMIDDYMVSYWNEQSRQTDHPEVNRVIAFIQTNYQKDLSVKNIAKHIGMDENYLSGLFKKKTGESLIHYIHRVRIDHAEVYLLNNQGMSIADIAEKVGFLNDNYFIRIFKRIKHDTPSQFRRKYAMDQVNEHE
ncbi:response regulator [Virgibacillus senegalensis]|uniref:response regulator n=1 Tax=Virgibacillus senegalensis TaxID=1499679 RepID=UPI00069D4CC3|nr:response regulator [Virgibacillus senegalensis]